MLAGVVRDGDIKLAGYGKYITGESGKSSESSHLIESKNKSILSLIDTKESTQAPELSSLSPLPPPVQEPEAETAAEDSQAISPVASAPGQPDSGRQDGGGTRACCCDITNAVTINL